MLLDRYVRRHERRGELRRGPRRHGAAEVTKLGKIWTDSVAYIALAAGAGLSIAANVADIFRVRGQETDALDITIAVAYPALVVLMVEVFVSSRWRGLPWPM